MIGHVADLQRHDGRGEEREGDLQAQRRSPGEQDRQPGPSGGGADADLHRDGGQPGAHRHLRGQGDRHAAQQPDLPGGLGHPGDGHHGDHLDHGRADGRAAHLAPVVTGVTHQGSSCLPMRSSVPSRRRWTKGLPSGSWPSHSTWMYCSTPSQRLPPHTLPLAPRLGRETGWATKKPQHGVAPDPVFLSCLLPSAAQCCPCTSTSSRYARYDRVPRRVGRSGTLLADIYLGAHGTRHCPLGGQPAVCTGGTEEGRPCKYGTS